MESNLPKIIESLSSLLQIDSVKTEKLDDKPFGEGVFRALDYSLNLAKEMGFETYNYSNYIGEVVWGKGESIAILCHLDVVPVGDETKWKHPPFSATLDNGEIYARGALDDKGPFIATLYALKRLKDEGFLPNKEIRLILGCDEESGWGCIKHYKTIRDLPETGFSPDASFPVIYAEKGILHAKFFFDYDEKLLFDLKGGVASNVVCDKATASCKIDEILIDKYGLNLVDGEVESLGISAHGSEPDKGVNAIKNLILYLNEINAVNRAIYELLFEDKLKLKAFCDQTGNLTMSPNVIKIENGKISITVDFRYPATLNFDEIFETIKKIAPLEVLSHQKPLFNDIESPLIQTLNKVYERHTGKTCKPIAIGGGTYARALKLGAGFGPETEDDENLCHQPNERISIEKLEFLEKVYHDAIKELSK